MLNLLVKSATVDYVKPLDFPSNLLVKSATVDYVNPLDFPRFRNNINKMIM